MKNIAASIQDRLKNRWRESGVPLNRLLEDSAIARLFARLSDSDYSEEFILKGAQLFTLWADKPHRPTRHADFLSYGHGTVFARKQQAEPPWRVILMSTLPGFLFPGARSILWS